MARISLQEQYENKDVIQQINILKDDVNRVSETTENVNKDVIQQINNVKDDVNTVSGTAEEAKTLAQQASDTAETTEALAQQTANKAEDAKTLAQQASDEAEEVGISNQSTVTSGSIVADTVSAKLKLNKVSGASEDSVIPIASASQTGMMNAQTYAGITNIDARLSVLERKTTTMYVTFPNDDPEQSIITSTFQTKAGRPPVAGDYAVDITLNLTYGYDGSVWVKVDTDVPIPQFSIDTPGLIKGNDEDGTVFAEADGTGSIKGWDALKQSVQNNTTAIEQNSTATQTALDTKQDKLTFDNEPVAGSDNVVKSGGIYDALSAIDTGLKAYIDEQVFLAIPQVKCSELSTMYKGNTSLIETPFINAINCTSLVNVFMGCSKLKKVNYIHTPNVTNMDSMFYNCSSLTSIPEMDTGNVTSMDSMFHGCSSLVSIPEMDTGNVTNMKSMFYGCSSLVSIPEMDTGNVTNMKSMFYGCSSLTSTPEIDTSNASDIKSMFCDCSSLTSVTFTGDKVPSYASNAFTGTPIDAGNGSIYVPDDMVDAYKAASEWSYLASVIKGISEKP